MIDLFMLLPLLTRVFPTLPLSEKTRKAGLLILLDISTMEKHLKIQIPGFNSWRSPISMSGVCVLNLYLIFFFNVINLFMVALGPCCCVWALSSFGKWGLLFVIGPGLLTVVASLVVEHRL